ncbi:FmdB family zinc ribbon protein [Leucobacter aridicollis]|uniref:Putative FmdB family regulatory protein n=1 Tax=Leucobacter aridicollis TaxID=283878 RepID=A0A852RBC2_9MICO|nr:FmdB family zinc ribbon protein [Leucobacter aridicollis]MBL3681260.1 FmdB family transcriptional regulator [Leucobacter aridicollis]NYD27719.1 putative FmdB family regulatory protein [Leucobacter aridicollis]
MPTYAYRCADCGHSFDIYQSFSDATLTECPECGGDLRKVFGSLGVTFNGSGFYRTDSRASGGSDSSSNSSSSNS